MKKINSSVISLLLVIGFSSSAFAKTEAHSAPATGHAPAVKGVSADESLRWLKNGNTRFTKGSLRKDGQAKADVERLSTGQAPHAIVLSCSDSRVPPELVFDQKLGEIFTVRTAGEALDNNAIGSIEYAVEHLGSHLIVVMGHTSCGAVKAALDTIDGKDAGTPALNALVKDLHPRLQSFKGKEKTPGVEKESWANVEGVAADLLARSALLKSKWEKGEIKIQSALYHLDSGNVEFSKTVNLRIPANASK